jgi:phage tail sheath protein FI
MGNLVGIDTSRSTAGPLAFGADPGDSILVALLAERGPVNTPTLVNSMGRFRAQFGEVTPTPQGANQNQYSTGFEILNILFSKGATQVYVLRLVGSGAATADVTIEDRGGTPEDTLTIAGLGPGTWANDYSVTIEDGTQTDTFRLTVRDPNADELERFDNLEMVGADLERVNDQSDYIQLTDEDSSNSPPDNRPATGTYTLGDDSATSATASTTGVDDNDPSASTIVGQENADGTKTGLKTFRESKYGRGFILAPDLDDDTTVIDELEQIATEFYRVYLSSTDEGADLSTAQTQRNDHDHFGTGFYFPRAKVTDDETQGVKTIPVVGHVAADWQSIVDEKGPGKAPAGRDFEVDFVRGLETQPNGQDWMEGPEGNAETLMANHVNPVYDRDGSGGRVWGARAATAEAAWKYLHAAYLYNLIASRVENALGQLIYEVADDQFFQQVRLGIRSFLVDLYKDGAFNGEIPGETDAFDPEAHAFHVKCDESMLSGQDKQNGIVRVEIVFKAALVAETIKVDIAKQVAQ